jgi:type III restriction enzyme
MTPAENPFFERPVLNSPYEYPRKHWELDDTGQPTQQVIESRRVAEFFTPIPRPRGQQNELGLDSDEKLRVTMAHINDVRYQVDQWRLLPKTQWKVTPETARLLEHWRNHKFASIRPFFCQVEAVETMIWLTEVAPHNKVGEQALELLKSENQAANAGLNRLALKLATGAGKTTVMAMLIAWQTVNAVRRPQSNRFTKGFLIVAPGLTIKDRLRVLQPNDPDSYYQSRELVPSDMLDDLNKAKIVITNYHSFKLRERLDIAKGTRGLLQGHGDPIETKESEGQMLQRVMKELMSMRSIYVLNDEAHHCYREKLQVDMPDLKGEDKEEAEKNNEAARLWINGIDAVNRHLGVLRVADLSATPFFLRGSGYAEGTLFPWVMSDFSLMDAIECGIVKLPRVPIADNLPGTDEMPMFRNLWAHIGKNMPKKGRSKANQMSPADLPPQLQTALQVLYGHYQKTFDLWEETGISVPPCFIVVCNNTASSKLVYDFVSGYEQEDSNGSKTWHGSQFKLFSNYDEHGNPLARPNTILIDSEQLESGAAFDPNFQRVAADEIARFRREIIERSGDARDGENISDQDLLREVMNTVGKKGRLGGGIRCVVSVSMLTEGWDTNTVTHVLGVRAFGTQLLCEQVIGRALRRQSYEVNEEGLFPVEYADVLGIPFDFNSKPVISTPQVPRETLHVRAMRPDRDSLEITFPRVLGYRVELPNDKVIAKFDRINSELVLTPDLVGPTQIENAALIGQPIDLTLTHMKDVRPSQVVYELTTYLLKNKWRDPNDEPRLNLFGQLKRITKEWIDNHLVCKGGTYPAQLKYKMLADMAAEKIVDGINLALDGVNEIEAVLDPYNPLGSTNHVNFNTTKPLRYETNPKKSQVNWAILDSTWEQEFCRVVEKHPKVRAYVKNQGLGFEVPYRYGSETRRYLPDFIVLIDDGNGDQDLLHLVIEIKGYRGEDAKMKKDTMDLYWIPGVNRIKAYGRWAFAEFCDVYEIEADFDQKVESRFAEVLVAATAAVTVKEA